MSLSASTGAAASERGSGPRRRPGASAKARKALALGLQVGPATAFVAFFLLAPLVVFFLYSLWRVRNYEIVAEWNLDSYKAAVTDDSYRRLLWNTVKIAGGASLLSAGLAFAFAHTLRFKLRRWQEPLLFAVVIAMFSGYLVRVYAWRTLLGDSGIVNSALRGLGITSEPLSFLLFNRGAAIVVLANFLIPLAVLPVYAALQNVKDSEIEAARDLGCGSWGTFWRVTAPLAWPGIFFSWALAFLAAAGDYVVPQLVGGANGTMVGVIITDTFQTDYNFPRGAALAFTTLLVSLAIITVVRFVGGKVLR